MAKLLSQIIKSKSDLERLLVTYSDVKAIARNAATPAINAATIDVLESKSIKNKLF